jgi:chromosome segregation ATPase|tara:strand:+ start:102 stop:425 length:324 start_codon:yes stop_codon:yes gene_type:complete
MNSVNEKEKKLNLALTKLKNLNLKSPDLKDSIETLDIQKNQLEIEKKELEKKHELLQADYDTLTLKLNEVRNQEKIDKIKQTDFSEKIDELNQETDTLLEEIDKWQT